MVSHFTHHQWYQDCGITLYPITSGFRIVISHFIQSSVVSGLWYHTLSNHQWYQDCGITRYPNTSRIRIVVSHFTQSTLARIVVSHFILSPVVSRRIVLWYVEISTINYNVETILFHLKNVLPASLVNQ